jgi:branched-chain amino acid transport system substrate-binding protein
MNTRKCRRAVLFTLLLVFGAAAAAGAQKSEKKEIVIGYAVSLTGKFSTEGNYIQNGYRLWADQVNAMGGLLVKDAGRKLPVRLLGFDDQSDAQTAVKLYQRLIEKEQVDLLLGPWGSGINFAVSALTDREGWPLVMPSASADNLYDRGFKTIFQATTLTSQSVAPLASYVKSNPSIKTIAIAYENFLFTLQQHDFFLQYTRGLPLKIALDEKYPLSGKEFGSILAKMKSADPDAVIVFNIMPSSIYFVRQMEEIRYRPKFLLVSLSTMVKEFHDAVGPAANGIVETGFMARGYSPEATKYWADYQRRYGVPPAPDACHAYIAAQVLGQAVEAAGSLERPRILDALRRESFKTLYGHPIKYDASGRIANLRPFLTQWLDGQRSVVWPQEMAERPLVYPWPGH